MAYVDLGKVHARVYLYNTIPGVIRNKSRLRGSYSFSVALQDNQGSVPEKYNVITLQAFSENGDVLSGAIMPEPVFEPVDNFMLNRTNTSTSATTDVYWKQVGQQEQQKAAADGTPVAAAKDEPSAFTSVKSKFMKEYLPAADQEAVARNDQLWMSQAETVNPIRYSEDDYQKQPITYDGTGYKEKKKKDGEQAATDAKKKDGEQSATDAKKKGESDKPDGKGDTAGVEETSHSSFVRQQQAKNGVWWGIETVSPFKDKGHPFWVVIRPAAINVSKSSKAHAFVSVVVCEEDGGNDGTSSSPDSMGYVEFVVEGSATFLRYVYSSRTEDKSKKKTGAANQSSGSGKPGQSGGGDAEKKSTSMLKTVLVNAPWLSDAFVNGEEMRIGFMSVMGRLCIYTSPDRYHVVTITGSKDTAIPFNLKTPRLSVYGYGCKASVSAFHMTFKKRGWVTMPGMKIGAEAKGQKFPEVDDGKNGVRAGDCSSGTLISVPISIDKFLEAKQNKKDGKTYGAVFREYMEVDFTASADAGASRQKSTTINRDGQSNYDTGMINPWGKIHMVYSDKVAGMHDDKPFWFVYFEVDVLQSDLFTPAGTTAKNDEGRSTALRGDAGFPVFYNLLAHKAEKTDEKDIVDTGYLDITPDLVSFSCNYQLDAPRPCMIEYSGSMKVFNADGKYSSFTSRARGAVVWMKWSTESSVEFTNNDIVYSGIAFGREMSMAPGEEYVSFELADHWKILAGIPIKNSPFYDGLHVYTAVSDLCGRAGIAAVDDVDKSQVKEGGPAYYFLGAGLAYDKPMYKFSGESSIKDCIMNVMKAYELYLFFDKSGVLHMAPVPGGFTTEHDNEKWDPGVKDTYYLKIDQVGNPARLILDGININSTLSSSVYNSFFSMSVNRGTGSLLIASDSIERSMTDPDSVGYLGFVKEIRYDRPDLGNQSALNAFIKSRKEAHSAPGYEFEFNTIGHNPVFRPGQFISVLAEKKKNPEDDKYQPKMRVTKISHDYQASKNEWKTVIGGYQIVKPSDGFNPSQKEKPETPADPDAEGEEDGGGEDGGGEEV